MYDTEVRNDLVTRIYYLHGALHLRREPLSGKTYKSENRDGRSLLEIDDKDDPPLFITEGSAEDKDRAIRTSNYLTFAYQSFLQHQGPLVIFGHSLNDSDKHLIEAIRRQTPNTIAISIRGSNSVHSIEEKQARLRKALFEKRKRCKGLELLFFDSSTHPLGSPALRVS